jgi:hypothetical protein
MLPDVTLSPRESQEVFRSLVHINCIFPGRGTISAAGMLHGCRSYMHYDTIKPRLATSFRPEAIALFHSFSLSS